MDSQRRLTLPQETLRAINANPGDFVKVYSSNTPEGLPCIVLEKYEPGCWLCGKELDKDYEELDERRICSFCLNKIRKENTE